MARALCVHDELIWMPSTNAFLHSFKGVERGAMEIKAQILSG